MILFELPASLAAPLRELSRGHGATPFFTLLAAFQALLGRHAGQDRVTVGTPIAGRGRAEPLGSSSVPRLALACPGRPPRYDQDGFSLRSSQKSLYNCRQSEDNAGADTLEILP
ncbi:MAG: hypothetical protein GY849_19010 [Deltaproteobacteria bacterium]|nr:hypothetical protein [Deltaproteobacteria bacterium]